MPRIIILAGPNGAGKTTFANAYLTSAKPGLVFVNADEIARTITQPVSPTSQDVAAARTLLATIDALALRSADFMFETTLATRT